MKKGGGNGEKGIPSLPLPFQHQARGQVGLQGKIGKESLDEPRINTCETDNQRMKKKARELRNSSIRPHKIGKS